tara:strand:+ start:1004 stop:1729 length:726 start_codon:yes stop_codon:yes gene_type:complete
MKVICAGWGRTGTRSLKYALEHLTGEPSYHMQNILLNKKDAKKWHNSIFLNNEKFDWEDIYKGYGACLDFPSCNYYKELMDYYPDAKVILTVRDAESWVKSWNVLNNQILKSFTFRFLAKVPKTSFKLQKDIHNKMILGTDGAFQGAISDKERMKRFDEWNQSVIDYVPKERLLVYEVKDGWAPLCKFLDAPIPDMPFFYKNKTKNMGHMSRFINAMFILLIIAILAAIISSVFFGVQYFG